MLASDKQRAMGTAVRAVGVSGAWCLVTGVGYVCQRLNLVPVGKQSMYVCMYVCRVRRQLAARVKVCTVYVLGR